MFEWGEELPKLHGRRVALRALSGDDTSAILAIFGDPEVMRYWGFPPLGDHAAAAKLIDEIGESFRSRTGFQWGVCARETGEVIGTCSLFHVDRRHRRGEVGYALRRSAWGRGLATEAVGVLLRFSFQELELHRLEADVDPDNARSLRLLEGLGFRREGYLRERWHHLGDVRDTVFFGLLRREWSGGKGVDGAARATMQSDDAAGTRTPSGA